MAGSAWTNQAASLVVIQSGGTFQGLFVYSPTVGTGNLIASIAAAAGTDPYTNTYQQGIAAYGTITDRFAAVLEVSNSALGLAVTDLTNPPFLPPQFGSTQAAANGTSAQMYSGASTAGAVGCQVSVLDSVFGATTKGLIELFGGKVLIGNGSTVVVDDNNNQVTLGTDSAVIVDGANNKVGLCTGSLANITANAVGIPAGGGPFIPNEGFHVLTAAANTTALISTPSSCVGRVKLLPWNMVQLEIQFSINAGNNNTTFTLGAPPSSSYSPVDDRRFPCSCTSAVDARLFVPHGGGGPQVVISAAAAGASVGAAVMFGNN